MTWELIFRPLFLLQVGLLVPGTTSGHQKKATLGRTSAAAITVTTCSDDSKPYMILKALDESYTNHIGFAIIRARGEE